MTKDELEQGAALVPRWNADGLICAVAQDAATGAVLMVAWMNEEALRLTLQTGRATYWSRSRNKLWIKGEDSGHTQRVLEALVDCDQDCIVLRVEQTGAACHTGAPTCFYRRILPDGTLERL
jgi:phosphoribosyl-AMP cyclohydrolase